jgi:GNAT superfamily N-acetyltransferase
MTPLIAIIEQPTAADRQAILGGLVEFNRAQAPPARGEALCVGIVGEDGELTGGLYGTTAYDWLAIELLFVPEALRSSGTGSQLLARAEEQARQRGCIGAWLDTFSFQARGFYEKLGYELAGTIPDHPIGGARYFLMKRWG